MEKEKRLGVACVAENDKFIAQSPFLENMQNRMMPSIKENNLAGNQNNKAMSSEQKQALKQLACADFVALELHLYLDTHPDDAAAMELYTQAVRRAKMLMEDYERRFAPLRASSAAGSVPWRWIESPWSWEQEV